MRRRRVVLLSAMTLAILLPRSSQSDPILVSFDERSPGVYGSNTYYADLGLSLFSFSHTSGDERASVTEFTIAASPHATTPPNVASGEQFFPNLQGSLFAGPISNPSSVNAYTDFLSFSVVGTGPLQSDAWRVAIYNDSFELLDFRTGTTNAQVVFIRPQGDIQHFRLFTTPGGETMDTLLFNTAVVPEPATLLLVALGGGVACWRRRRHLRSAGI